MVEFEALLLETVDGLWEEGSLFIAGETDEVENVFLACRNAPVPILSSDRIRICAFVELEEVQCMGSVSFGSSQSSGGEYVLFNGREASCL